MDNNKRKRKYDDELQENESVSRQSVRPYHQHSRR